MFGEIHEDWPQPVKDRLQQLSEAPGVFEQRTAAIRQSFSLEQHDRLLQQALNAPTATKRLFWLRREADLVFEAAKPHSGCSTGCSHCCSIGLMVCEGEAQAIGREIGRKPAQPPEGKYVMMDPGQDSDSYQAIAAQLNDEFKGVPCSFLGTDGNCQIYSSRPMACRWQINLDKDGLLCELVPNGGVPVPYLNTMKARAAYVIAFGKAQKMADIRYFFPPGSAKS